MKMRAGKTKPQRSTRADIAFTYLFKLLIILPLFQKKVARLRINLGIPQGLLPFSPTEESMIVNQDFDLKLEARGDSYLRGSAFKSKKHDLDRRAKMGMLTPKEYDIEIRKLLAKGVPKNRLQDSIDEIIGLFNLPRNFAEPLKLYVYHGIVQPPKHRYSISTHLDDVFRRRLVIEIYAPLTDRERKDFFKKIDNQLELNKQHLLKSSKPHKNADRDINILMKTSLKDDCSSDFELVNQIFPEDNDISILADRKRRNVIWQARSRVKKTLARCFPPDVIPLEWRK